MRKILLAFILVAALLPAGASATVIGKPTNNLGLIGYWPLDENYGTQAGDFSGNRNTGTINGTTTWTSGIRGGALMFGGGTGDYVAIPGFSRTLTGGGTISAWVYVTSPVEGCDGVVFSRGSVSNTGINAGSCGDPTIVGFHWNENGPGGGGFYATGGAPIIPLNEWVLLVLVGEPTQATIYAYSRSGQNSFVEVDTLGSPLIDALRIGQDDGSRAFTGKIDDVRIYNRALTAAQVTALYQSRGTRLGASSILDNGSTFGQGLAGHWTFDGIDTTSMILDKSGNGYNASFVGSATSSAKTTGKLGQAFSFRRSLPNFAYTPSLLGNPSVVTLSAWVNLNSTDASGSDVVSIGDHAAMRLDEAGNGLSCVYYYGSSSWNTTRSGSLLSGTGWHHVACVIDPANSREEVYIDGVSVTSDSWNNAISYADLSPYTVIGGHANSGTTYDFDGKIDDVRVYNRALSTAEVRQLAMMGDSKANSSSQSRGAPQGLSAGLVGMWSFDGSDFSTTQILDRSGSANNGSVFNASIPGVKTIGKIKQAVRFNGTDSYASFPTNNFPDMSATQSVSFWMYYDTLPSSDQYVVNLKPPNGNLADMVIGFENISSDCVGFQFGVYRNSSNSIVCTSSRPAARAWHHVAFTAQASNKRLYIDGALVHNTVNDLDSGAPETLYIGSYAGTSAYFNGKVDDLRVYSRFLSAADVTKLYELGR